MPIDCSFVIPRLAEVEMRELAYEVMRHAFAAHRTLGALCDEKIYQAHLLHLLAAEGIQAEREVPLTLTFRSFRKPLFLDLVVARRAIYELKAVCGLADAHATQLLNYLFLTNAARGKLINFRPASVEARFVNSAMDDAERRRFQVEAGDWHGPPGFREMLEELVADWGTGLDRSFYAQAVIHCLGGEDVASRQIPMQSGGVPLGHQRFHLLSEEAAFRVTTFPSAPESGYHQHLRKLLASSPLRSLHWVNIARHTVSFRTING